MTLLVFYHEDMRMIFGNHRFSSLARPYSRTEKELPYTSKEKLEILVLKLGKSWGGQPLNDRIKFHLQKKKSKLQSKYTKKNPKYIIYYDQKFK